MNNETEGWAVFWDGSYDIGETVTLRAGFRYTEEEKSNRTITEAVVPFTPEGAPPNFRARKLFRGSIRCLR